MIRFATFTIFILSLCTTTLADAATCFNVEFNWTKLPLSEEWMTRKYIDDNRISGIFYMDAPDNPRLVEGCPLELIIGMRSHGNFFPATSKARIYRVSDDYFGFNNIIRLKSTATKIREDGKWNRWCLYESGLEKTAFVCDVSEK